MAEIEVFVQRIRPDLEDCDEFTMQDKLVYAARQFCQDTWFVRRNIQFTTTVPGQPQNVGILAGNGQVTLQWTPVQNALSYNVNAATVSGQEVVLMTGIGVSAVVVPNLTNNQVMYFTVQAVNGVGAGLASAEVSATPTSSSSNTPAMGAACVYQYSQQLVLPNDEEVIGIRAGQCAVFPMGSATPADMDPKIGPSRPRAYAYAPNGNVLLYPVPDGQYTILVLCPVQPRLGAVQLPDELATNYLNGVTSGGKWQILKMPRKAWTDKESAQEERSLFLDEINKAKSLAMFDFQGGNIRVQAQPFVVKAIV